MAYSAKTAVATVAILATTVLSACGSTNIANNDASGSASSASDSLVAAGTVEVFAAASLNAAGADLEKAFEAANPGTDITFNYAGSSKLVQQMEQGATPDLLLTADTKTMDGALTSVSDLSGVTPEVVATNALVLATSAGNPKNIQSVDDLKSDGATVAICASEVPCGNLAHKELDNKGITLENATEEQNVSDVATKVSTGAVDAGFIYSTDAATIKKDQDITEIALTDLERNQYPMAVTKTGESNDTAKAFDEWIRSDEAQKILEGYGFGAAE